MGVIGHAFDESGAHRVENDVTRRRTQVLFTPQGCQRRPAMLKWALIARAENAFRSRTRPESVPLRNSNNQ
jgi:hypothetical protein